MMGDEARKPRQTPMNKEDLELLQKVLAHDLDSKTENAFKDMENTLKIRPTWELTEKQRKWVNSVSELNGIPKYENLVSRGLVPRGKDVPMPDVLKKLPKRPPGRI